MKSALSKCGMRGRGLLLACIATNFAWNTVPVIGQEAPTVLQQPESQSVPAGVNVKFVVEASGSLPLTYQWQLNGTTLSGATNSSLKLDNVQVSQAADYSVVISNLAGVVTSSNATLVVNTPGPALKSIPISGAADMVYDGTRDIMYATTGTSIQRYQLGTESFLPPFQVGTNLSGIDLSFDGTTLVAADYAATPTNSWIFVVDPVSGASRQVTFSPSLLGDKGTTSVAFGNDGAALVMVAGWGSGPVPVWRYDPNSDETTSVSSVWIGGSLSASGDGSIIGICGSGDSSGALLKYAVASRSVVASGGTGMFNNYGCGVNSDGSQLAGLTYYGTYVFDGSFNLLKVIGVNHYPTYSFPVGAVYHPTDKVVFFAWVRTSQIVAYATDSLTEIGRYEFGSTFGGGIGLKISRDGELLFASVGSAINYLSWRQMPKIITNPTNQVSRLGQTASFAAEATGVSPLRYQWRLNGTDIDGATDATLNLVGLQYGQAGAYNVLVYTPYGFLVSASASLTVYGPPVITAPPGGLTISAGDNATFSVAALGTGPLRYQWEYNGSIIQGATNTSYSVTNAQSVNAGTYSIVVTNAYGVASTNATLVVNPVAPTIVAQPAGQRRLINGTAVFVVAAKGSQPFSYQWQFGGTNLDAATNATLTLASLQMASAGDYRVVVSNAYGYATSTNASLVVVPRLVLAWGYNYYGQTNVPVILTNPVSIGGGVYHSVAAQEDGSVIAWGNNSYGQCNVPAGISNVVGVAAGYRHSVVLRGDGTVVVWGNNTYGQTNIPADLSNVVAVAAGSYHTLALKSDGPVVAWGRNNYGQTNVPASLSGVVGVAAGNYHSVALKDEGKVVAWGYNAYGQTNVPARLTNVVAVAAGGVHSVVLLSNGTAVAWGDDSYGQTNVPSGLSNLVAVAAGRYHNLALRQDGTVGAWGSSPYGQTNVPLNLSNTVAIAAGNYHSLALVNDGAPFVVRQPVSRSIVVGSDTFWSVTAVGAPSVAYQWQFDGNDIDGATNASLFLTGVPLSAAGNYACILSNSLGVACTARAALNVLRSAVYFGLSSNVLRLGPDGFHFQVSGLSGHGAIIVWSSTNMVDWVPILTNPAVLGDLPCLDTSATNRPARFYRAVEQ